MIGTNKLSKINAPKTEILRAKFKTIDEVWERVGLKFSTGINSLAQETKLTRAELIEILVAAALEPKPATDGQGKGLRLWLSIKWQRFQLKWQRFKGLFKWNYFSFWFQWHWAEALLLIIILVLVSLLLLHALWPRDTVRVNVAPGLPAFHVIRKQDVRVETSIIPSGSFASENEVIGRYLLHPVLHDAKLLSYQLSAVQLSEADQKSMASRQILSVTVKASTLNSTLAQGDHVQLLFSPRNNNTITSVPSSLEQNSIEDVIILSVDRRTEPVMLVVAVKRQDDLAKLLTLLSVSEVFVSQPPLP